MRTLAGYTDRISACPGERVGFKVSSDAEITAYRADLVRLFCVDDHRDGPGLQEEVVPCDFADTYPARHQPMRLGSSMQVQGQALTVLTRFSLSLTVFPTLCGAQAQTVLETDTLRLEYTNGAFVLAIKGHRTVLPRKFAPQRWWRLLLACDGQRLTLTVEPLAGGTPHITALAAPDGGLTRSGSLSFANAQGGGTGFNGKIAAPRLWDNPSRPGLPIADWDFAGNMGSVRVPDRGPHRLDGRLLNMPLRAVKGRSGTDRYRTGGPTPTIMTRSISTTTTCPTAAGRTTSPGRCPTACQAASMPPA